MGKHTGTIKLLALAGLLALSATAFIILSDDRNEASFTEGMIVATRTLPENNTIDGEVRIGNVFQALTPVQGGLSASGTPNALSLRLRDAQARYYDIEIGRTIALTGLLPRTSVSVLSGDHIFHDSIPADWNGRIMLDKPPAAPFDISFTQNEQAYRIGIMTQIGGAL